jgi:hypothetical protein
MIFALGATIFLFSGFVMTQNTKSKMAPGFFAAGLAMMLVALLH